MYEIELLIPVSLKISSDVGRFVEVFKHSLQYVPKGSDFLVVVQNLIIYLVDKSVRKN